MRSRLPALVVACVAVVSGCGRSEPEFRSREGLAPAMSDYVRTSIEQKFGGPHDIRVWDKLPLKPHAAVATVNDAPKIKGGPRVTIEILEKSADVTTLSVDDVYRPGGSLAYSISGGPDSELFAIDRTEGEIKFRMTPSHMSPGDADKNNTYELIVQVSDGSLSDSQSLIVKVVKEGVEIAKPQVTEEPPSSPEPPSKSLSILLTETHRALKSEQEVVWSSGTLMPAGSTSVQLDSYNPDTHTLSLLSSPALAAKSGDKVVIGPGEVLKHGRALYAEHCQHCHGVAGDGKGPTAEYLNVRPRDYRRGLFKFTSTKKETKAHRNDLVKIVEEGIPGTYMPSFKLLKPEESQAIIEYVMFLAMRGETEFMLHSLLKGDYSEEAIATRIEDGETADKILAEFVGRVNSGELDEESATTADKLVSNWTAAQTPEAIVVPKEKRYPSDAASIERGRTLFLSNSLKCVACHGESGLGDGVQTYSITVNEDTQKANTEPGLFDAWGNKIKPRNLRLGMYRGGRRPIDIYCRIDVGIKGTPMPGFGAQLTDQQKWDLVNYVLELPYETRTPGTGIAPVAAASTPTVAAPAAAH